MNDENRKHLDNLKRMLGTDDNEAALLSLRLILVRLATNAPIKAVVSAIENLNDSFVDELIEWHLEHRKGGDV